MKLPPFLWVKYDSKHGRSSRFYNAHTDRIDDEKVIKAAKHSTALNDFLIRKFLGLAKEDIGRLTRDEYLLACAKASYIESYEMRVHGQSVRYGIKMALNDVFGKGR